MDPISTVIKGLNLIKGEHMSTPIIAKREEGVFHLQPAGTWGAICYAVHDLGLQQGEFNGIPNVAHKVVFSFELNKRISSDDSFNGKRYTIHLWITNSLGTKANLPKMLEPWLGRPLTEREHKEGFDISQMVGKNCLLNITHKDSNGKPKATIKGIMALPEGMPTIQAEISPETPEFIKKAQARQLSVEQAETVRDAAMNAKDSEDIGF